MQATASGSQPRRAPAAAPAGPAGQEGPIVVDGSEDEETEELEFLGSFATSIVGIQYYTGEVGANELVGLVREPHNPYDANAIRVENIRGEKVGHVPRQVAAQLAALIDRGDLEIEGVMPSHGRNKYKLPMEVYCYGPSVDILPTLAKRLRACDCLLQSGSGSIPGADSSGAYGYGHGSPSGRGGARYGGAAAPTATERVMTHKQLESALDNMFEELLAKRGPPTAQPHAAAAPEVTTRLLPHQTAALAWMIQRENGGGLPPFWERKVVGGRALYVSTLTNTPQAQRPEPIRGGILADEMGLGKTLTVLALIATNRPGAPHPAFFNLTDGGNAAGASGSGSGAGASAGGGAGAAGPSAAGGEAAAAAAQEKGKRRRAAAASAAVESDDDPDWDEGDGDWSEEEERGARGKRKKKGKQPAAKKAAAAKGKGKAKAAPQQAPRAPPPSAAGGSSAGFTPDPADPEAPPPLPPAAGGPRGTLLVCPLSVLSNWTTQLEEHTAGSLSVVVYHGADRNRSPAFLAQQDIVITTYNVLSGELSAPRSGLLAVPWLRVVLDEGHTIKNAATQMATAATRLRAERRWIVTGTPLQNHVGDLFSLCRFLGLVPLNDRAYWRRLIDRPLKKRDERALLRLQILMGALALRRTKATPGAGGRPLVSLLDKKTLLLKVDLGDEDASHYAALEAESRDLVARAMREGALLRDYTSILTVLMRLRQVCGSHTLCPDALELLRASARLSAGAAAAAGPPPPELLEKLLAALTAGGDDGGASEECSICLNIFRSPCITRCAHVFCRPCITAVIARDKPTCPLCRAHISEAELIDPPAPPPPEEGGEGGGAAAAAPAAAPGSVEEAAKGSAKVLLLLNKLSALQPGHKAVVFSQFLGMLDMTCEALQAARIPFVRLDGRSSAAARAAAIEAFGSQAAGVPRVFVASLKAGGVGMNLTAASEVHVLDPHWNPAVEDQAADRVHRLGQERPVTVFRYVARGTIEERMLDLQERKRALAEAAFAADTSASAREARARDIRLLMQLGDA